VDSRRQIRISRLPSDNARIIIAGTFLSPTLFEILKIPGAGRAYGIPSDIVVVSARSRASNCATALEFHQRLTGRSAIYADRCETMTSPWPRDK